MEALNDLITVDMTNVHVHKYRILPATKIFEIIGFAWSIFDVLSCQWFSGGKLQFHLEANIFKMFIYIVMLCLKYMGYVLIPGTNSSA